MSQLRRFLLALAVVSGLSALTLGAAAAGEFALDEPTPIAAAGGEEDDGGLHVSDETLATSLFIPFCFVGATLAVFVWAIRNRARREDDDVPMSWWRTREWYTRGSEDEA